MAPRTWLNPGEEVVVHVRPHWSWLGRPLLAVVVVLAGAVAALAEQAPGVVDVGLAGLLGLTLLWLVLRYFRWSTTVMVVTDSRLLQRGGALGRRVRSLPLVQIADAHLRRRVRDRLIGTGDLVVTSVDGGREVFERVPRPGPVVRELQRQVERARAGTGPSAGHRLARLEQLWRRGAISRGQLEAERYRLGGR
jgi:uncharacterized membrane protein YdbT with pleckstrin-like domain